MKNRIISLLLILCCVVLLCGCAPSAPAEADGIRTVTDCAGRTVEVPADPQSICCICPFSGSLIVMFGCGDRLTSTCNNVVRSRLLDAICPGIADVPVVKNSGSINGEEVLEIGTDLIIVNDGAYETDEERAKLDSMGIPYVVIGFTDLESQLEAMLVLGRALGAEDEAQKYVDWCRGVYSGVSEAVSAFDGEPVRLYHSVNEAIRTDYYGSICAEWIAMTGAENVSVGSELNREGDKAYTTLEQIYEWDPDMIICNEAGVDDYILSDGKWAGLACVRAGEVYQIPVGISRMGHPTSTETPLALMWLTNLLHPDLYDIDLVQALKDYYLDFYEYEIDDDIAEAMIEADEMRAAKSGVHVE
ncbi:MAG: ABC transporter substrate-binding protein [Oscillospiraceae bacterium]|nr:ABC transporter substrate-binding protein [Oscillospiraceae bacterium]